MKFGLPSYQNIHILPPVFIIVLDTAKQPRTVRLRLTAVDMELRSSSLQPSHPLTERIVNPRDDVADVYSFPAGNEWSRPELKLLNVTFMYQEGKEIFSLLKHLKWENLNLVPPDLKLHIVLM